MCSAPYGQSTQDSQPAPSIAALSWAAPSLLRRGITGDASARAAFSSTPTVDIAHELVGLSGTIKSNPLSPASMSASAHAKLLQAEISARKDDAAAMTARGEALARAAKAQEEVAQQETAALAEADALIHRGCGGGDAASSPRGRSRDRPHGGYKEHRRSRSRSRSRRHHGDEARERYRSRSRSRRGGDKAIKRPHGGHKEHRRSRSRSRRHDDKARERHRSRSRSRSRRHNEKARDRHRSRSRSRRD